MFLPLLYRLRAERVPVGTTEALALGRALAAGRARQTASPATTTWPGRS